MKKEEKGSKGKIKKKQEDAVPVSELGNDEYGFEYNFFITKIENIDKKIARVKPKKPEKKEDTQDQSKTFFLPDFFIHED